jgi:hypothetical protein
MSDVQNLKDNDRQFLIRFYEKVEGDPSRQFSMFTVGREIGMDGEESHHRELTA